MTTHELAKILLALPDVPVATTANNHFYHSDYDKQSHGRIKVQSFRHFYSGGIVIGNGMRENGPNWGPIDTFFEEPYRI